MLLLTIIIAIVAFILGMSLVGSPEVRVGNQKPTTKLSREDAFRVLALTPEAGNEEIKEAYRRLVQKLHPDQGGSAYLTELVVQAKNTLIKGDS